MVESRNSWRRTGVLWIALMAMLVLMVVYFLTSVLSVHIDNSTHDQAFEWSDVWVRWIDGVAENFLSEFGITVFVLKYADTKWAKTHMFAASEED